MPLGTSRDEHNSHRLPTQLRSLEIARSSPKRRCSGCYPERSPHKIIPQSSIQRKTSVTRSFVRVMRTRKPKPCCQTWLRPGAFFRPLLLGLIRTQRLQTHRVSALASSVSVNPSVFLRSAPHRKPPGHARHMSCSSPRDLLCKLGNGDSVLNSNQIGTTDYVKENSGNRFHVLRGDA